MWLRPVQYKRKARAAGNAMIRFEILDLRLLVAGGTKRRLIAGLDSMENVSFLPITCLQKKLFVILNA